MENIAWRFGGFRSAAAQGVFAAAPRTRTHLSGQAGDPTREARSDGAVFEGPPRRESNNTSAWLHAWPDPEAIHDSRVDHCLENRRRASRPLNYLCLLYTSDAADER